MRETVKEVTLTIDDKDFIFRITKMDALNGSGLAKFGIEKLLPAFGRIKDVIAIGENDDTSNSEALAQAKTEKVLQMIPELLSTVSETDLIELEKKCLRTVECKMPAGWIQVYNGKHFTIPELEYDVMNTLMLCYMVLEFNVAGFFGGKSLGSVLGLQASPQPNA